LFDWIGGISAYPFFVFFNEKNLVETEKGGTFVVLKVSTCNSRCSRKKKGKKICI
jgi:hypothetical protein